MSKKCASCEKGVFTMDPQLVLDNKTYHKECAKCTHCKGQLTLLNFAQINGTIYCKTHYLQLFSKRGTYSDFQGHSPSAWELKNAAMKAAQSPTSQPQPNDTPASPSAPVVKESLTTTTITPKTVEDTASVSTNVPSNASEPQPEINPLTGLPKRDIRSIYKPMSSTKETHVPRPSAGAKSASAFSFLGGGGTKCSACGKSVYSADPQVADKGSTWHKSCFKCAICKGQIVLSNLCQIEGAICCKSCFKKLFSARGNYDDVLIALGKEVKRPQNSQAQSAESVQEQAQLQGQTDSQSQDQPAVQPLVQAGTTSEGQDLTQPEDQEEPQSESQVETQSETQPATEPDVQVEIQADIQTGEQGEDQSESRVDAQAETQADGEKSDEMAKQSNDSAANDGEETSADAEATSGVSESETAAQDEPEALIAEKLESTVLTDAADDTSPAEVND